ncbi:MAG: replication initiator protein [Microviridae sp.]|nr:MAG: replication initiator protein [Microviridae sp.]
MPCYSPITGFASRVLTANGKRKITFDRSAGYTDMPMTIPCGGCIGCRIDKSRQWALRCVHESKMHPCSSFVTLTYDDAHLPPFSSLDKPELQLFFKTLRNRFGQFRYYASGEYGENLGRPHYHLILFGLNFAEDRRPYKKNPQGDQLYKSKSLTLAWGKGDVIISDFTYATAAYTARYVMKKVTGKLASEHYNKVDPYTGECYSITPEFAVMSLRPGIGSTWYEKYKSDAFPSDFLVHQGKKHPVPRFYSDRLKSQNELLHKDIKFKRKQAQKDNAHDSTPDRLYVRETVKLSKIQTLKRTLQ